MFFLFKLSSLEVSSIFSLFVLFVFSFLCSVFYAFMCIKKCFFVWRGFKTCYNLFFVHLSVIFPSFFLNIIKEFIDVADVGRIGRNKFIFEQFERLFNMVVICGVWDVMWYDYFILPLSGRRRRARCDIAFLYGYYLGGADGCDVI